MPPEVAPKFDALDANATNRPSGVIVGSALKPFANAVPSGVEINCTAEVVQPFVIPMQYPAR